MEKAFEIQKQIRDNAKTLNSYMTDLQSWEAEMKRKEAALSGEFEQVIPPVRSKAKKEKPVHVKKKPEPRISASDYLSWEKFDVDKACEDIDMEEVGPASLDSKKSQLDKMEKLRDEAQHQKERGNNFVKQEKWDEAIACYNRAIELVNDDAIYFANRGLCYLKKEMLQQAERDCSEALRLRPGYVKALARRGAARERRGALHAAAADLAAVLRLEPRNRPAAAQLRRIQDRMPAEGTKAKSSPNSTPSHESESTPPSQEKPRPRIVELEDAAPAPPELSTADNWRNGLGENVTVLRPVKKPPHLRSKRPLKSIPIREIPLGETSPEKPPTRLKILEVDSDSNKENNGTNIGPGGESAKLAADAAAGEKRSPPSAPLAPAAPPEPLAPPINSVQFMAQWKSLRGDDEALGRYFSMIPAESIPGVFAHALESAVLSDWARALRSRRAGLSARGGVAPYLRALAAVRRFPALALFLSADDKRIFADLLEYCRTVEKCSDEEIEDLKKKYELV